MMTGHTGLMTEAELAMYDSYVTSDNKFFVPAVWAASLAYKSRRDGRIKFDDSCNEIIKVPQSRTPHRIFVSTSP